MAITAINIGAAPDDGTGDVLRRAFQITNENFADLDTTKADTTDVANALALKVDVVAGKGLSTADFTNEEKDKLDGVEENATYNRPDSETVDALALKVDKVAGQSLMTDAERSKLSGIATAATANETDAYLLNRSNHTGPLNWAWSVYGGTANAVTLAPTFARTAYTTGDEFRFRATATNTGATTINVGGLGAKTAVTVTGAALPAGYIRTGVDTVCVYDGTQFIVQREVELGSNANGAWRRFADGRQECQQSTSFTQAALTAYGGGLFVGNASWVFPLSFFEAPMVSVHTYKITTAASWGLGQGTATTTQTGLYVFDAYASSGATKLDVSAKGKWY